MKTRVAAAAFGWCLIFSVYYKKANAQDNSPAIAKKIEWLLQQMTLEEKVGMLHGNSLFSSAGVKRLGVPELTADDGPLGVREEVQRFVWKPAGLTSDSATFFPNGSAMAATWNPALLYRYGKAIGQEANARHKSVMLAPAFNICRTPLCGRTYEYYSEDPFLNAQLAVASVKGIQSQHVAACIKHFAVNNQETYRDSINAHVDERALREIYLPAFKAAVQQGKAFSVMSAYNKVNGKYCSENEVLLTRILKNEWGFKGLVMSDWGGTHSTVDAANNGLDLEMGSAGPYNQWYFADPLLAAVKSGAVSMATINEKVRRILWVMFHTSLSKGIPPGSINTPEHSQAAYDIAAETIVLLKNEKETLPLDVKHIKTIAVIGDNAVHKFATGGFGAGVKARYEITALEGLRSHLGKSVHISFAQGYKANYLNTYNNLQKEAANKPNPELIAQAAALAKSSDAALVFIGSNRDYESEGTDRKSLELPFGEQELVDAVTAANPNAVIIVTGGAPYDMGRIKRNNHTIVWSGFNGSEGGNALADMLVGKINPSGKLPFTFPASLGDSPAHALQTFPGEKLTADYKEGIFVGYRWYDTRNIAPLYCFGYGLSYTTFTYGALTTDKKKYRKNERLTAIFKLANTGTIAGKEVVQLYVSKLHSKVQRPVKELKGFKKITLNDGQSGQVSIGININDLAYYDDRSHGWVVEPGDYRIGAGSSSADIRRSVIIRVLN